MAASPLDTLTQTTTTTTSSSNKGSSSFNFLNVLIGMLLGNLLGKTNTIDSPNVNIKSLPSQSTDSNSAANLAKGNAIIATAKTYMGVPYVFGGESPTTGLDCSSFTQLVMKKNGITLPRTAAEQYSTGTAVDKANLQIGDLVFFTTYKPGASHVGFYMGNQQFIHASSAAKQVTISSLDESYYTEHYIGSRRYIK
jgi:cell wall-associated NlpC family hydrolase